LANTAAAEPPPNADPALAPWFRSLLQPGTSISCCSVSDCRATEYRIEADHYEALIGDAWFVVPPDKVLQRTDNPTGRAVVCWTPHRGIVCFARATESCPALRKPIAPPEPRGRRAPGHRQPRHGPAVYPAERARRAMYWATARARRRAAAHR